MGPISYDPIFLIAASLLVFTLFLTKAGGVRQRIYLLLWVVGAGALQVFGPTSTRGAASTVLLLCCAFGVALISKLETPEEPTK